MYSKVMLTKLLEKTKEGKVRWEVIKTSPNTKRYEAVINLLRFIITSDLLGGELSKRYRHTLEIRETDEALLKDSGEWVEYCVNDASDQMMQTLISTIEGWAKEQKEAEKKKKEETINYILNRI